MGRDWGFHSGTLTCRNIIVEGDFTVKGNFNFGDAVTDTLTVNGAATFNAAVTVNDDITIGSGKTISWNSNMTQTTVGSAGSADALPSNPTGYLKIKVGTSTYVVPYFAES